MTSPIDPLRPGRAARRNTKATGDRAVDEAEAAAVTGPDNLPVPVGQARTVPPEPPAPETDAAFAAHLIGQDGQKRGLRAGPSLIETAKSSYNRTEWSGAHDRRTGKGRATKTDV